MPIIQIENVGTAGLISDLEPHTLPPEAWSSVENITFVNAGAEKSRRMAQLGITTAPTTKVWILPWATDTNLYWFVAADNKIYRTVDFTSFTDVSKGGGTYTPSTPPLWSGGVFGGVPIVNIWSFDDQPQSWDAATNKFVDLPNWNPPTKNRYCRVIRTYKNYLMALYTQEEGEDFPTRIRWSHPADPGTVPTSWDEADPTVDAGTYSISETTAPLIDCMPLGDYNIVYKEDSTWIQRLVGGEFIFNSSRMLRTKGLLCMNGVQEFFRKHFVVSVGDIWVHDGQQAQSVVDKRVRDRFFNDLNQDYYRRIFVVPNFRYNEMWLCYPDSSSSQGYCTKALIWNWEDNTWTERDLPEVSYLTYGTLDVDTEDTSFDNQTPPTPFNSDFGRFNERYYTPALQTLVGPYYKGFVGQDVMGRFDYGYDADIGSEWAKLQRDGLGIIGRDRKGNWKVDQTNIKFVRAVYPQMQASTGATVDVYVGSQMFVEDPISWSGPFNFNPATQLKIDCRVAGRLISLRFESNDTKWWRIDGYKLDIDVIGRW